MADKPIPNLMEMSDEEISNMSPSQLENSIPSEPPEESKENKEEESGSSLDLSAKNKDAKEGSEETGERREESGGKGEESKGPSGETPEEPEEELPPEELEEEDETSEQDVYSGEEGAAEEVDEEEAESATKAKPESQAIDYKAEYEKLLTPFRANKKDVKVENVDEARHLMQMGVGYSDKMKGLKDKLRIIKTLENNKLLDDDKISFLIDLEKGEPAAVTKFLKDSKINPLDLDLDSESDYKPKAHTASDKEVALDLVLDEIRGTESFDRTLTELGKKWDSRSKQILMENPKLIKAINEQIGNGVYDKIWPAIERERMFGRLTDIPDLEAYKLVGEALQANGALEEQTKPAAKPKSKPAPDPRLAERKRAASPTRGAPANKSKPPSMLGLSDEEFEKMSVNQLA